jgi:hypothetical protein
LKKLTLKRETLRNLTLESLGYVKGGLTYGCSGPTYTCMCSAAPGCGGTNNCTTGSAGCNEN